MHLSWRFFGVGAALLGVGLGLGYWLFPPAEEGAPEDSAASLAEQPAAPGASAATAGPGAHPFTAEPYDSRGLARFLGSHRGDPDLDAFGAAFMGSPGLRDAWETYQRDDDLRGLFKRLQTSPAFQALLDRSSKTAFSAKAIPLLNDRRLQATLVAGNALDDDKTSAQRYDARELAQFLATLGGDPDFHAFGAAFLGEARLREAWEAYQKDDDLHRFSGKMNDPLGPFPALVERFSGTPFALKYDTLLLSDRRLCATLYAAQFLKRPDARSKFSDLSDEVAQGQAGRSGSGARWPLAGGAVLIVLAGAWTLLRRQDEVATAAAQAPQVPTGARLADRYATLRSLARIENEEWIEARDASLDRVVLIRRLGKPDAAYRDRLSRAAGLRHPALPDIYEIADEDGALCVVYERWHGRSVAQLASAGGRMPTDRALTVLEPVCLALDAAHARGVFHGNLTPEKILINEQGYPKLLELGGAPVKTPEEGRALDLQGLALCWRTLTGAALPPGVLEAGEAGTVKDFLRRLRSRVAPESTGVV